MRYRSKPLEVEAHQWRGSRHGITFTQLQDWGAPVIRADNGDQGTGLILSRSGGRAVNEGDWIVRSNDRHRGVRWACMSDGDFRRAFVVAEDEPVPGFATVTAERVAFRRWNGTAWEWRHGGLTQDEAEAAGWQALYDVTVPT